MASIDDINSTLQGIARQLGLSAQSNQAAVPPATTTASPKFTGISLGTTATTVLVVASSVRHGILFHNPGGTATIYVFPSLISSVPTSAALGGALAVAPGSTVMWPASQFANVNIAFSGFAGTGSSQPFTIVEFF